MPNNPFHEEIPNIQPLHPLVHLEAMRFCPVNTCMPMEHSKLIPCFALPIKLFLLQLMIFLISAILILALIPARGR